MSRTLYAQRQVDPGIVRNAGRYPRFSSSGSLNSSTQELIGAPVPPGYANGTPPRRPADSHLQEDYFAQYGGRNHIEMQGMGSPGGALPGRGRTMQDFRNEACSSFTGSEINNLHIRIMNSGADEAKEQAAKDELKRMQAETTRMSSYIRLHIKDLYAWPPTAGGTEEKETRCVLTNKQKQKFMDLIQEYREVEAKSRDREKARGERQIRIVKPDATQEELRYALESEQGSQVFANALQPGRNADARNVHREVQERREALKKIAETMIQLQQLFEDMAMMTEQQDEPIQYIEATAVKVETTVQKGNEHVVKAQVSATKARKKRVCCFWVLLAIVVIAAIAITMYVLHSNGKL
ncbi:MAG: Plasma membrane t-SNARE, secretory vesicle fusion [Cyphobasidiales sp. Tagirdzhanova-0007]|nr:MAG: Plasma membrane t-SNARE, secretory vesicle fusion [Cyphobasidiales sp. Tagirdzhanova-0007]